MEIEEEFNGNKSAGKSRQLLAAILASMYTLTVTLVMILLVSTYDHLGALMRPHTSQWFLVITPLAIIVGFPIAHFCCECYGRKVSLCLSAIPLTFCCMLISFGENSLLLLLAFILGGIGSTLCLHTVPIYVSEISSNSLRSGLGTIRMIFTTIGFSAGYLITDHRVYRDSAFIIMFLPLLLGLGFVFMPESPIYLYRIAGIDEATKCLMWLRDNDHQCVHHELFTIQQTVPSMTTGSYFFQNFFLDLGKRRGFIITCGLFTAQSLWQVATVLHIRGHMSGAIAQGTLRGAPVTIFLVIQIIAAVIPSILLYCFRQKILLLISCVVMSSYFCVYIVIALIRHDSYIPSWILLPLAISSIVAYYFGMGTFPSIIAVEVFQREVLSLGFMLSIAVSWIVLFFMAGIMTVVVMSALIAALINVLLSICLFFFIYFFVPETTGKAIESITGGLRKGFTK